MISRRVAIVTVTAVALSATAGLSQSRYPDRMIRVVVPSPPGGPSEAAMRPLADRLSVALGQSVIIENISGAGGTLGAAHVASAPADGYTLLATPPGPLVTAATIYDELAYDPAEAFAPVALLFSSPQLLSVHPSVPTTTVAELVAYAKEHPGELNYGSPGQGTFPHVLGEQLNALAGIEVVNVPYVGTSASITALVAGEVDFAFESATSILPLAKSGLVRVIAVAESARMPQLSDVATTAEQGFPTLVGSFWNGILAPAGTPPAIVDALNAQINKAMLAPDLAEALPKIAASARLGSPADFGDFIARETAKWTPLVEALELTPQ